VKLNIVKSGDRDQPRYKCWVKIRAGECKSSSSICHFGLFIHSLSRCISHVPFLPVLICSRQVITKRYLLLVRSMATLDAEVMSELAASLEGAVRVAL
jgi:hypothetical protein